MGVAVKLGGVLLFVALLLGCKGPPPTTGALMAAEPTRLFWGDTHLHTNHSADAFFLGNRTADPDTAYRWAKGLPVVHPVTRARVQIGTPLDFLVVSDHAEMLGIPLGLTEGDAALSATTTGRKWVEMMRQGQSAQVYEHEFSRAIKARQPIADFDTPAIKQAAWGAIVDAAEKHYTPCAFTSFIGWEWTATPNGNNLHRVVFTPGGREPAEQLVPYSAFDSDKPEDLWAWLEETSTRVGTDFIAIPHRSDASGGRMFDEVDGEGRPITADYARTRSRWEPVVEVTQIHADSEAEHVRSGLLRGLQIEQKVEANPYKLGMIGSTDSHTGLASAEENNFWGTMPLDSIPQANVSASGLAAVWAEENTRTAIFAAFKRKEVYATTGPRIRLRFFGGWHFKSKHAYGSEMVQVGYVLGHPMGSDLTKGPDGEVPRFIMYAVKDPEGANLDRIQLVKGWVDADGLSHERIYDVAFTGPRQRDAQGRVPSVSSMVDLNTGENPNVFGAPSLVAFWEDPDFDPEQRAFYYVRVLEIPTPRHSLYDDIARGLDPRDSGHPPTIQERAYSSPIWYTP